jgi:dsDNA-binding SOS-regulon protein
MAQQQLAQQQYAQNRYFDEANEAGDAHEADKMLDTIHELNAVIEDTKIKIKRELRSI